MQENIGEIWKVGSTQERKSKAQSGIDRMLALQDMMRQYDEAGSGAALPAMDVNAPFVARIAGQGGGIHIKPSHRGRLTDLKARTGKTEAELYNDGNPAHKRMVVFARNARKWHGDGGMLNLFFDGGD